MTPAAPIATQHLAALLYGYGPITLKKDGDYAVVEIEYDGRIYALIRAHCVDNFYHHIEPTGIEEEIKRQDAKEPKASQ